MGHDRAPASPFCAGNGSPVSLPHHPARRDPCAMPFVRQWRVLPAMSLLVLSVAVSARAALPRVPEGFEVRLVATVPAVLYGTTNGKSVHRSGDVILRRANDVPGSTDAQRRWHIDRIDWSGAINRYPRRDTVSM